VRETNVARIERQEPPQGQEGESGMAGRGPPKPLVERPLPKGKTEVRCPAAPFPCRAAQASSILPIGRGACRTTPGWQGGRPAADDARVCGRV